MMDNHKTDQSQEEHESFSFEDLFGFAAAHATSGDSTSGDSGDDAIDLTLVSTNDVADAANSVLAAKSVSAARRHRRAVVSWVEGNASSISGDEAHWHNLIAPLNRSGDYDSGLRLARVAMERFPRDADLLADAILCAGRLGDWKTGDELLALAKEADFRADESWTLAVYVADYLKERARTEGEDKRTETIEETLEFLRDAKERLPWNDRLLCAEADTLVFAKRIDEATQLLEDVIFVRDRTGEGVTNPARHPVPQCCGTYLRNVLGDTCDYEKVIEIADAGIRFSGTENPSISVEYFFYRKALAMDGQLNSNVSGAKSQGFGNQEFVRNTMNTYALAYALDTNNQFRDTCRERFLILGAMGGIDDLSIERYCSGKDDIR